jgi:hypothetical protein
MDFNFTISNLQIVPRQETITMSGVIAYDQFIVTRSSGSHAIDRSNGIDLLNILGKIGIHPLDKRSIRIA